MAAKKKKVGLVLASIHNGLSLNVLDSFVRTAIAENTSLFVFPGGRLDARRDYENLRNPVYYLVNDENLDGCISWSSAIRYTQSKEEFEHFHANFDPLPFVTMGFKLPGHPCVEFDAYNGVKALVGHCISVHGARKIAFLQGPVFHQSAKARLEGYYDALKEAGLFAGFQSPLVTDPFDWEEGATAAAQIFEERSLVPGRDFDTLVGSSDLLVLGAINYFAMRGYHVPADYRAVGFNNSEESRVSESPLSTVQAPYAEMSKESFKILRTIMSGKKQPPDADVLLRSDVIIRESCGCSGLRAEGEMARQEGDTRFSGEELAKMVRDYLKLDTAGMNAFVLPLIHALLHEEHGRFFSLFEKTLIRFFNSGHEVENLLRLIDDIWRLDLPENIRAMDSSLYRSMFRIHEQLAIRARYEKEGCNTVLNSLKCELLGTRDRNSLIHSLARYLPKIGISAAVIVLYSDEKNSVCVGSFSPQGIDPQKEQLFPARLLVPANLKARYEDGIFMVQPLFIENQSLGYFVHNVPIIDGVIFEELRSAVSYALKGISLLEETIRAKRIAEQAEKAKTEFLHTLENGLYNPLQGIMDYIEKLEQKAEPAALPAAEITELKNFVLEKEAEAGSLMDFTLSRVDELTLRKTLFCPEELLPGIGTFPLLLGDTARLAQCFSLIREQFSGGDLTAGMGFNGLIITFRGRPGNGKTGKARHFSLLLVERIILMHGGEFSIDNESCIVRLPWTTLSGQDSPVKPISPQDHILVLGDPSFLPENFFPLPRVYDSEKTPRDRIAFIVWNASGASVEETVKVAALQHIGEFAAVPFLCYGEPGGGTFGVKSSIIDTVEYMLKSSQKGAVLFIGTPEPGEEQLFHEGGLERIQIDSMAAFNETVAAIPPSLIVFNSLNPAGAEAVRRHPLTVMAPIVMISSRIDKAADVMRLSQYPRLIICHRAVSSSPEFKTRLKALSGKEEILPPHTGVLVKKAILYFDHHVETQIFRWKLADSVNVSEDYLTRIFHREMGMSPWDYLNRLKVFLAAEFIRQTDRTIQDIAWQIGFHDHAYFCRVFKKIYGVSPKQLRKN